MPAPDIRIDRVVRATFWNHQTVSLVVADNRLYVIRTGVLAAAATGSVVSPLSSPFAGAASGDGRAIDEATQDIIGFLGDMAAEATSRPLEKALTGMADKDARKAEARIATEPLEKLATGWMSANLPLTEITAADVTEARQLRADGIVPQLNIATRGGETLTLRFPQTPIELVRRLATYLRRLG